MVKKTYKKGFSFFIVGIILGIGTMAVFAYQRTESPEWTYGPQLGYSYCNSSELFAGDNGEGVGIEAYCNVRHSTIGLVPAGYMGAKAYLYKDDAYCKESAWIYNGIDCYTISAWTENNNEDGYYYADGLTKAYKGNGYNTYAVYESPILYYED